MKQIHGVSVFAAIVLMVAVFTAGQWSRAQDKTPSPSDKTMKKGSLPAGWKKLDLSPKQKTDAYAIVADYRGKIKALELKIADLKAKEHSDLVGLLTDSQKQQLAKSLGIDAAPPKTDAPKVEEK